VNTKAVMETVEALYSQYLDVLEDVCNIESPTADKAGVDAVGEYIVSWAKKRGFEVSYCRQTVSGDAISITMNPSADGELVCLSGHMDTVHPHGLFGTPAVRRDGEMLYGPGAVDCKGGIVAAMLAMDALYTCGYDGRPVRLILQSDEENSSLTSNKETVRFMCEQAKGAVVFFNLEGSSAGKAVLWRKGIWRCRFVIGGKACHSSHCDEGASAIAEAAHKILALETLKDPEGLTCNCGVIHGGTVANSVAHECIFDADIRFATDEQLKTAQRMVDEVASHTHVVGCTCRVEEVSFRPAMTHEERNERVLARMNAIWQANGMDGMIGKGARGGSDAAYVTRAGVPCVDNLGIEGGGIHSVKEHARMRSLAKSACRMVTVICEI